MSLIDETLAKFQLNKALSKGGNEEQRKSTHVQVQAKKTKLKVGDKSDKKINYVPKPSLDARNNFFF
jgi:hypothetical protein